MVQAASQISYGQSVTVILPQPLSTVPKVLAGTCVGWDTTNSHVLVQFSDTTYGTSFVPISQIQ
jgi:hypothetical protein